MLPASAAAPGSGEASVVAPAAPRPPVGKAWLVGVVTDPARHPRQDVNVEAWPVDPGATEPAASDLTYENVADGQEGYFRLEVPLSASTVQVRRPAKVTVTVRCRNVDPVLGKVTVAVNGQQVTGTLKQASRGTVTLTLPKLKKPGKYPVQASYLGDSYVKKATKKLVLTVTRK